VPVHSGGELRFCVRGEPRSLHPLAAVDDIADTIRYLTGGVLLRVDRATQKPEPELATSWSVSHDKRSITFNLRPNVRFSDGTPLTPADVEYTFRELMRPDLEAPLADSFRTGSGDLKYEIRGDSITITFPRPLVGFATLFDQLPVLSAHSPLGIRAVTGPFQIKEYRPGAYLVLSRNPNYWKSDAHGRRLPYLDSVRLSIQQNRDNELARFRRGEFHLIDSIDPVMFDELAKEMPGAVHDSGPSLDSEMVWFNQRPDAPLPAFKREWFRSQTFRDAISKAISRDDICRIAYHGHARPAYGPVSPSNTMWFDRTLKSPVFDSALALRELRAAGFVLRDKMLYDASGHVVEFSVITNSGNETREKIAALLQQDLANIGIALHIVPLDFKSLIERITASYKYESCLLGLRRVELDPNSQMNVWLSSAPNHQWNPLQKAPATDWEAEIDRMMLQQNAEMDTRKRKAAFDRVQQIAAHEQPLIYLVNPNSLSATARELKNVAPTPLPPQIIWNAEFLSLSEPAGMTRLR
jgi:peptide/nickel transport system substrate-binding protein